MEANKNYIKAPHVMSAVLTTVGTTPDEGGPVHIFWMQDKVVETEGRVLVSSRLRLGGAANSKQYRLAAHKRSGPSPLGRCTWPRENCSLEAS